MEKVTNQIGDKLKDLYVITPIFNPAGYSIRYDLYYGFEAHMKSFGINLVTVECIYDTKNTYAVTKDDNPLHIQLKTDHPLWHKENLINLAVKKLPKDWKYVLWLDADIEFLEPDWPEKILAAFEKYDILQVFKYAHFLGPDENILETHFSLTYTLVQELPISKRHYNLFYPHPGYGWGMSRKAFEDLNGLIDFGILGSGDAHMAFALLNRVNDSIIFPKEEFTANYLKRLLDWQEKAFKFTEAKRVGFADCVINHHFHGYREDRGYVNRMKILINNIYDPVTDIEYDLNGLIQIKNKSQMKKEIKNYFQSRNEDVKGNDISKISVNLPSKTPDEILKNAQLIKRIIEADSLRKVLQNHFEMKRNINSNDQNATKQRSKSSSSRLTRRRPPSSDENQFKKIEMFYELRIGGHNIPDSENSSSTEDAESISSSFNNSFGLDSDYSLNPNRSFTYSGGNIDEMMNKYGSCCSKSEKAKNEPKQKSDNHVKNQNNNNNNQHQNKPNNNFYNNTNTPNNEINNNINNTNYHNSNQVQLVKIPDEKKKVKENIDTPIKNNPVQATNMSAPVLADKNLQADKKKKDKKKIKKLKKGSLGKKILKDDHQPNISLSSSSGSDSGSYDYQDNGNDADENSDHSVDNSNSDHNENGVKNQNINPNYVDLNSNSNSHHDQSHSNHVDPADYYVHHGGENYYNNNYY